MSIAYDNAVLEPGYFSKCSNNQNILYVCAMLVKIFGSWKAVVFLGILMVNISVLLAGQIGYWITKKRSVGVADDSFVCIF